MVFVDVGDRILNSLQYQVHLRRVVHVPLNGFCIFYTFILQAVSMCESGVIKLCNTGVITV